MNFLCGSGMGGILVRRGFENIAAVIFNAVSGESSVGYFGKLLLII